MHEFKYKGNSLYCETIEVKKIIEKFGTPLYIYSYKTILDHFYKLKKAFSSINPLICYSVKANSNLAILNILVKNGAGLDIVSGGELYKALKVKCPPKEIVYASVGKTPQEIERAIKIGVLFFNVESSSELDQINRCAQKLKRKVRVCLRINPDIEPQTHKYITTGRLTNKFGIDFSTATKILKNRKDLSFIDILGIHIHIGSQIIGSRPFVSAITRVVNFIKKVRKDNIPLRYLNIGGGLGIIYDQERPQTAKEFAKKILPLLKDTGLKIILEPGRFIVGNAGILVTKVLYVKDTPLKRFIIVDAAMNDLIRPVLYGAYHKIVCLKKLPLTRHRSSVTKKADVVGPICESGDFLGKDRELPVNQGDYLAILGAGAYGFAMSSNYNSRLRTAEILVRNNRLHLIRERETYTDLVDKEHMV